MIISISNIDMFAEYIMYVSKINEMALFEINDKECIVALKNSSNTVQSIFTTSCVKTEPNQSISFGMKDLVKFSKCISIISSSTNDKTLKLEFDNTYVKYDDKNYGFKLITLKNDVVESIVSTRKKNNLVAMWDMKLSLRQVKKITDMSFIADDPEKCKVYFYAQDGFIIADVDRKNERLPINSLKVPITNEFNGDWNIPVIISMTLIRFWNLLKVDEIQLKLTNKRNLSVSSELKDTSNDFIKFDLISQTLIE